MILQVGFGQPCQHEYLGCARGKFADKGPHDVLFDSGIGCGAVGS